MELHNMNPEKIIASLVALWAEQNGVEVTYTLEKIEEEDERDWKDDKRTDMDIQICSAEFCAQQCSL